LSCRGSGSTSGSVRASCSRLASSRTMRHARAGYRPPPGCTGFGSRCTLPRSKLSFSRGRGIVKSARAATRGRTFETARSTLTWSTRRGAEPVCTSSPRRVSPANPTTRATLTKRAPRSPPTRVGCATGLAKTMSKRAACASRLAPRCTGMRYQNFPVEPGIWIIVTGDDALLSAAEPPLPPRGSPNRSP